MDGRYHILITFQSYANTALGYAIMSTDSRMPVYELIWMHYEMKMSKKNAYCKVFICSLSMILGAEVVVSIQNKFANIVKFSNRYMNIRPVSEASILNNFTP